jgi:actinin alpha 1/4
MMEQNGLYSEEYGENTYMEQEDEWEREGLLDPAWEKQQKKVS